MPELKNRARIQWVNVAIYGGISLLTVALWCLACVGAAFLLGLLP